MIESTETTVTTIPARREPTQQRSRERVDHLGRSDATEGRAAPLRERGVEHVPCLARERSGRCPAPVEGVLPESRQVDAVRRHAQHIPGRFGRDHGRRRAGGPIGLEHASQARQRGLQGRQRRRGWFVAPQPRHEPFDGHDAPVLEREMGDHRPRLWSTELELPCPDVHLDRSEEPYVHPPDRHVADSCRYDVAGGGSS